ncbi:hypothetical protein WJX79_004005 [Trebouxia sp. C0005]
MAVQEVLGFSCINDTRNGLLLAKALKETFGDIPTFAALQRKQLQFEGDQRRFNRCLAFHASQSRHSALSQAWALRLHQPISYTRDKCERLEPQQLFGAYQR